MNKADGAATPKNRNEQSCVSLHIPLEMTKLISLIITSCQDKPEDRRDSTERSSIRAV